MRTIIPFPGTARVEQEAAEWIARLDRDELSPQEQARLRAWLSRDPCHREALTRMATVWDNMNCLRILADLFPLHQNAPARPRPRYRYAGGFGLAALVLLALTFALTSLRPDFHTVGDVPPTVATVNDRFYRTDRGEQYTTTLPDGTTLSLNTQTEVRIQYDEQSRSVYLTQGEAHFEVTKDPARPFVVHAGQGTVRAVGTAFSVRLMDEEVEVLVAEGIVEVLAGLVESEPAQPAGSTKAPEGMLVEKGSRVSYTQAINRAEALSTSHVERKLAWRDGKWMFEGETLAEVLVEIERHSSHPIVIADLELAELRVGGYFDIGDVDGFLKALRLNLGVEVIRDDEQYLLTRPAGNPEG